MLNAGIFLIAGDTFSQSISTTSINTRIRRFRGLFGTSPEICSQIWQEFEDQSLHPPSAEPKHLLCALLLLKVYGSDEVNHAISKLDEKTFRKWAWLYIDLLACNLYSIDFDSRFDNAKVGSTCFVSLDATDCRIQEPHPFNPKWFSHKFNGPGLKYEVGLNVSNGNIVWVCGGYPCGEFSDLKLARQHYVHAVNPGEKTIADDTYKDANYFIYPQAYPDTAAHQKKIMARHETVNRRLKSFNVLRHVFRHELYLHPRCFNAVANVVQMMIKNGDVKIFQVDT